MSSKTSDYAVETFLHGLESPSDHLLQYFFEMEIDSASNLDYVCRMEEGFLDEIKTHLLSKGVSLFRWLIIKKGFRQRAANLPPLQ